NLKAAIQSSVVDIHFIDANIKTIESIISQSYIDATFNSKKMKKIITDFDGVDPENFESIYKEFYHVRSMAINTMRHGAPLDLNL
ncbi:MAG: RHH-type proline utilization regulon transcriptional repressor/proline dehydrogenase, partial [Thermoproteota archaeon]